jgi:hypothetical protein
MPPAPVAPPAPPVPPAPLAALDDALLLDDDVVPALGMHAGCSLFCAQQISD